MVSQGCTASDEDVHPAELTLRLDVDFAALGHLQRKKIKKKWLKQLTERNQQLLAAFVYRNYI